MMCSGARRGHPPVAQLVVGVGARDVLHGDPQLAVVGLAAVVDGDDVGVVERGGDVGLADESGAEVRVVGQFGGQDLQRVAARQRRGCGPGRRCPCRRNRGRASIV